MTAFGSVVVGRLTASLASCLSCGCTDHAQPTKEESGRQRERHTRTHTHTHTHTHAQARTHVHTDNKHRHKHKHKHKHQRQRPRQRQRQRQTQTQADKHTCRTHAHTHMHTLARHVLIRRKTDRTRQDKDRLQQPCIITGGQVLEQQRLLGYFGLAFAQVQG